MDRRRPRPAKIVLTATLAALLSAAAVLWTLDRYRPKAATPESRPSVLDRRLALVDLDCESLGEAVDAISRLAGVEVLLDRERGVSAPIELRLRDVTLGQVMSALASSVDRPNLPIEFGVNEAGAVVVFASGRSPHGSSALVPRYYDVRDLIDERAGTTIVPTFDFNGIRPPPPPPPELRAGQFLVERMMNLVGDYEWRTEGTGSVELFAGRLVVVQTLENHERVAAFLAEMRRSPCTGEGEE